MKAERYKEIMVGLGMPDSQSLLMALQQVANEVEQEISTKYKKIIMAALDSATLNEAENILYEATYRNA